LALDVNRSGVAVGEQAGADGRAHPVLWRDGQPIPLAGPAGFTGGIANGINDAGLIVGEIGFPVSHAAAWFADRPDQVIDLGTADGTEATLNGVSESGVLAGTAISTRAVEMALTGTRTHGTAPARLVSWT
jgi:uncharacterized membrane protein